MGAPKNRGVTVSELVDRIEADAAYMRAPTPDPRIDAFEEIKFLLGCWATNSWGSSVTLEDADVLEAVRIVVDEFPGYGALRGRE